MSDGNRSANEDGGRASLQEVLGRVEAELEVRRGFWNARSEQEPDRNPAEVEGLRLLRRWTRGPDRAFDHDVDLPREGAPG